MHVYSSHSIYMNTKNICPQNHWTKDRENFLSKSKDGTCPAPIFYDSFWILGTDCRSLQTCQDVTNIKHKRFDAAKEKIQKKKIQETIGLFTNEQQNFNWLNYEAMHNPTHYHLISNGALLFVVKPLPVSIINLIKHIVFILLFRIVMGKPYLCSLFHSAR
jgi:hypothetical protein